MKKYFKCLTKMQLISYLLLFLTAFLFNYWTPYAADDYSYMYNLGNGERITSVFQIFPSLAVHYMQYGNGRIVSHFFVMLFLTAPKIIFDVLNAFLLFSLSLLFYVLLQVRNHSVSFCFLQCLPCFGYICLHTVRCFSG